MWAGVPRCRFPSPSISMWAARGQTALQVWPVPSGNRSPGAPGGGPLGFDQTNSGERGRGGVGHRGGGLKVGEERQTHRHAEMLGPE